MGVPRSEGNARACWIRFAQNEQFLGFCQFASHWFRKFDMTYQFLQ